MKIRKTFAGNLPDNKIINTNSTSETDTYSCKYLNERNVIVSSEEPTTGEEVWIQRGKNLIDVQNSSITFPYATTYDILETGYRATLTVDNKKNRYFAVELDKSLLGKTITLSSIITPSSTNGGKLGIFFGTSYEPFLSDVGLDLLATGSVTGTIPSNFPSGCNGLFLLVYSNQNGEALAGSYVDYTNLQIEMGEVATSYEPYIPKKIHTKTKDGYGEFYNEEEKREVYSFSEQRIGTYLGKPLYRKTVYVTPTVAHNPNNEHGIQNPDVFVRVYGSFKRPNSDYRNPIPNTYPNWEVYLYDFRTSTFSLKFADYVWEYGVEECYITFEYTKTTD